MELLFVLFPTVSCLFLRFPILESPNSVVLGALFGSGISPKRAIVASQRSWTYILLEIIRPDGFEKVPVALR